MSKLYPCQNNISDDQKIIDEFIHKMNFFEVNKKIIEDIDRMDDINETKMDETEIDKTKMDEIKIDINNQTFEKTKERYIKCYSCQSDRIYWDYTNGNITCQKCGQVQDNILDDCPEWKSYEDNESVARCGAPINVLLPESSLGTTIGGTYWNKIKRLHTWNVMPYKERSLNNEFKKIHDQCLKMDILKNIETDACILYKAISEAKHLTGKNKGKYIITRGVNRISIMSACLYFACIRNKVARTTKEFIDAFGISSKNMNDGRKKFQALLKIRNFEMSVDTLRTEQFVKRFGTKLHLKKNVFDMALQIARNIDKLNLVAMHTPCSLATGTILLVAEINNLDNITRKLLSTHFSISDVTISKAYKKIKHYQSILTNNELVEKIALEIKKEYDISPVDPLVLKRMTQFNIDPNEKIIIEPNEEHAKFNEIIDEIKILDEYNEFFGEDIDNFEYIDEFEEFEEFEKDNILKKMISTTLFDKDCLDTLNETNRMIKSIVDKVKKYDVNKIKF